MRVVVIGGGYVGLPLAVEAACGGHEVTVYDRDHKKVDAIYNKRSYLPDVADGALAGIAATTNPHVAIKHAEVVVVCVPTPLSKSRDPDNSFILSALDDVCANLSAPCLIVLESTTFPGFTREVMVPRLDKAGFVLDRDVFVAFSPERTDPGNKKFDVHNTPKIVGAASAESLKLAVDFYRTFVEDVVPVSSTDTAEMVKLLENTYRSVNIGLVNEVAIMCHRLGISVWEVINAAATKPYGYTPFYPGPGLGGHCIPVDPLYLAWKLRALDYSSRFIETADEVNRSMPRYVVERVAVALNERRKPLNGSKILLLGVAYKADVADTRESPAETIMELLAAAHAEVGYYDPHVPAFMGKKSAALDPRIYDCVVVVTGHSSIDYRLVSERAQLIVDCRNVAPGPNTVAL